MAWTMKARKSHRVQTMARWRLSSAVTSFRQSSSAIPSLREPAIAKVGIKCSRRQGRSTTPTISMMAADSRELRFFSSASSIPKASSPSSADGRMFFSSSYASLAKATAALMEPFAAKLGHGDMDEPEAKRTKNSKAKKSTSLETSVNGDTVTVNGAGKMVSTENQPVAAKTGTGTFALESDAVGKDGVVSSRLPPRQGYGPSIVLTREEKQLFALLRHVREETHLSTTLRVAGGWVRDKLLATDEFQVYHRVFDVGGDCQQTSVGQQRQRLTSKFQRPQAPSMGRQGTKVLVADSAKNLCQPVDIDIALDDMLGREFADHLNEYLSMHGKDTVSVGVVLKNPEKSKHLETATMKVGSFWIDFVNLRAEEYTQDSRIPDLMRIGTASEDAFRRDLTINALFYNINTGEVEDWTGRGFDDLKKGVVATPLPPLTTLLDDPLRVLRSVRFAARLRFTMDEELVQAATDARVRNALAQKVSRERVGGEVDLMLRSPDPVGAMRLLVNLQLADTVFPVDKYIQQYRESIDSEVHEKTNGADGPDEDTVAAIDAILASNIVEGSDLVGKGLELLSAAFDHLADCRLSPPLWCLKSINVLNAEETRLTKDEETRRLLWYASFLKPIHDYHVKNELLLSARKVSKRQGGRKANRSPIVKLLVDDLKRPIRDAEAVERIIKAADEFTHLMNSGYDISATMVLLSDVRVVYRKSTNGEVDEDGKAIGEYVCTMNGHLVDSATEMDPVWQHAMQFRLGCADMLNRVGPLWRAALILSISEQLEAIVDEDLEYTIEGDYAGEGNEERRLGVVERVDAFATALQQVGLIGIWNEKPLLDGIAVKKLLPGLPKGPAFRHVMDEQLKWMTGHPGSDLDSLSAHLLEVFADYAVAEKPKKKKQSAKKVPSEKN